MLNEFKKFSNQLTLLRLLIIPVMYFFAYYNDRFMFAFLFVLAGITDVLDGFFARYFKQTSVFGNDFDSVVDRFFYVSLIPWFFWLEHDFIMKNLIVVLVFIIVAVFLQLLSFFKTPFQHTYFAKFSAVLTYLLLFSAVFYGLNYFVFYTTMLLAIISNLYEVVK